MRNLFPILVFISMAWSYPEPSILIHGEEGFRDSLKSFKQNFVPVIRKHDEIVKHAAFELCYDERYEQASWVAYRLTANMCDNNGEERTNNFREDKDVKSGSASPDDYKKSGYDRGHLCPAGDMGWSEETMSESFLMSNMSPQVPGFNRGIWKKLEGEVRLWAKQNQEIYIVTGGILKDSLKTIGNHVAVPEYFYKVILDIEEPEYNAIGFVLPNRSSKAAILSYAVSIDSVERLTGIDFFPALPDSLERNLEAKVDTSRWQTGL